MAPARCPICGVPHATCGPVAEVTPIDIPTERTRTVADLKNYDVVIEGRETTLRLTEDEARKRGVTGGAKTAEPGPITSATAKGK